MSAQSRLNTEQIDKELQRTQAVLATLGGALFELDSARERLTPSAAALTGLSAVSWKESGTQLWVLWTWYQAVSEALTGVTEQRGDTKLHPTKLQAVWDRLTGPSVALPPDSLDTGRRWLPAGAPLGTKASIAVVIQALNSGYEGVAETVAALGAVHDMVGPVLDGLDQELSALERRARADGVRLPNDARRVRDAIDDLRRRLGTDPLAVDVSSIPSLTDKFQEVKATVEDSLSAVGAVAEGLEQLEGDLDAAGADVSASRARLDEVAEKISAPPEASDQLTRLELELRALKSELTGAKHTATTDRSAGNREVRALTPRVSALAAEAAAALNSVGAPLAYRDELRGRLGAYRAKAHALGRAEDFGLDQLYQAAKEALYTAPCDLAVAERRVSAYQNAVIEPPLEDHLS